MKQLIVLFLLGLAVFSQSLYAEEKNGNTSSFWNKLRNKVEAFTPQKKQEATTAAAGVRGAPAAFDDIYWKNDASAQIISSDELDAFTKAMKLAESNDMAPAQAAFSEFTRKYPESSLRKDADQALAILQSTPAK